MLNVYCVSVMFGECTVVFRKKYHVSSSYYQVYVSNWFIYLKNVYTINIYIRVYRIDGYSLFAFVSKLLTPHPHCPYNVI